MKLAYIAGPYSADTIEEVMENINKAERVARDYWGRGYAVICPHLNSALFENSSVFKNYVPKETIEDGDIEIVNRCDVIVMLKGWENSAGSTKEHAFAISYEKEIIYEK